MEKQIKAMQKGYGESADYYSTDPKNKGNIYCYCDEIKEEWKDVGPCRILVYRGYRNGELFVEIEHCSSLTLWF